MLGSRSVAGPQDLHPALSGSASVPRILVPRGGSRPSPAPAPPLFSWLSLREGSGLGVSVSLGEIHFQNLEVLKCVFSSPKSPS